MMDRSLLEKVQELVLDGVEPRDVEGVAMGPVQFHDLRPPEYTPDTLEVASLRGLLDLLDVDGIAESAELLHVEQPTTVNLWGKVTGLRKKRPLLARAKLKAPQLTHQHIDQEKAVITLLTAFAPVGDRADILQVVGNLKDEKSETSVDDGVTQSVAVRAGAASTSAVQVSNPVELAPLGLFPEVMPVLTEYVLRIHGKNHISLVLANSLSYELHARQAVAQWLADAEPGVLVLE